MCRWPQRTPTPLYSMHAGRSFIGSISGLPVFTKVPPSLATPVQGTTFQVTCQAGGYPLPAVTWTRAAMPLPAGKTTINEGTLTISYLSPADNGFYDCVATNIMGTKKKRLNLAVQVHRSGLYWRHRLTLYIPDSMKGCFGHWAFGRMELTAMNCLSVHHTIAFQCAIIQCPKQESGTLRLNVHFSNANRLIQLAILVKHQKRVLKHYEGQFFESQTLPLRELYGYTEIYRRVIYSKTALF